MQPRFPRAPWFALGAFVVLCVVRVVVPVQEGPGLMLHALPTMILYPALSFSLADGLAKLERRTRIRRPVLALLALVLGVAAALAGWTLADPLRNPIGLTILSVPLVLWVVGICTACVGGFELAGLGIHALTLRSKTLSRRLVALGVACAGLGAVVLALLDATIPDLPASRGVLVGLSMLASLPLVIGFSLAISTPLTDTVRGVVAALRSVASGDLSVRLPDIGRDELGEIARAFNKMTEELREKEFLERAFGRYVALPVLEELRRDRTLSMSSTRRDATVVYADIRGFTSFSESATPEEVMVILNTYFARILEVVDAHQGYVNKFIGDALMIIFNAPVDQPDHPRRAVACAREMQSTLAAMNSERRFGDRQLQIGIGVNTGPLVAGSLGGERRSEYTVIGDTVNVAARLTSQAGPGEIFIGATTAAANDGVPLTKLPPLSVKGKASALEAFRISA